MAEPFIGEIKMFGGNFAPRGFAFCNGQLLPISHNTALFSILGTTYGGDGRTTFGLPDLRGRLAMHPGRGPGLTPRHLGQKGGSETHTLNVAEMPSHNHTATLHAESGAADKFNASNKMLATSASAQIYTKTNASADTPLAPESVIINNSGGNQSFNIESPYQTVNYIIALQGIFPSRS